MKKTPDYFLSEADLEGYDMVEILHELDSILDSGATLVEVEGFGNYDAERVEQEMACYG